MKHWRSLRNSEARLNLLLNSYFKLLQGRYCKIMVKSSTQWILDRRKQCRIIICGQGIQRKKMYQTTESRKWQSAQWRCFRAQDKRIVKDNNQLQEQLIYLGRGFIESYKCCTLSTSIWEIRPVSHVSRAKATCLVQCGVGLLKQHLYYQRLCPSCVRALAKLIVSVKTSVLSEVRS